MNSPSKRNLLVFFLFFGTLLCSGQTTIWLENFEDNSTGNQTGSGEGISTATWSTNDGDVDVRTSGGTQVLRGQNTDNTTARWTTNTINIAGYSNVSFSLDVGQGGTLDFGQDVFQIEYRIDGGTYIEIENASGDNSPSDPIQSSYSVTGLSGSTLEFRITFYNTGGSELYEIDNIRVQGDPLNTTCNTITSSPGSTISDLTTLNSNLSGFGAGTITDVYVTLDITHTWDEDLDISLTSPSGTTVLLSSDNGGSGDDYTNTIFDDAGATAVTAGTAPFDGIYRPEGNLSDFDGENPNGTWTLSIFDDFSGDTGTLNSFSISVCTSASTDLAVTKTVDDNTPKEGTDIVYTLSVTNNGPGNATNLSITDVLPAGVTYVSDDGSYVSGTGVWTIGNLNNGSTATLNITANVNWGTNSSTITNTITAVNADQTDSNATADDLNESIVPTLDQPPVLTITGNQVYCPGGSLGIAETVSLTDPDDATIDAIYIQISSGYVNGEDLLTLTGTHPNITGTWDATEGELTLQGPATFPEFEAAILGVEFSSSNPSPTGTRQFSITPGTANYLPPTGHYYEFVPDIGITWTDARDAAALRTYFGLQGYLATLTSQAEADFSGSQAQGVGWIGASDAATEGDWQWVTGPEAGTTFWTGTAGGTTTPPFNFAFWNSGEPNQSGNEDYAHITDPSVTSSPGSWNDLSNTGAGSGPYQPQGYVVEYGGTVGDPVLSITGVTTVTVDNVAPTASNPSPVTVFCSADVPASDINIITDEADNCTANPAVTFIGDVSDGGTNPEIITRTYRVTDDAGNTVDVTQTITVTPITINTQPSDQTVSLGSNATFTTSSSNSDTYQWQVSTNGGGGFSNISDGAEYSGTNTQILTVLNVDLAKDNYIFRILVSNSSGSCPAVTSNEATLLISVDSDGDGIVDSADLDDDNDGILDSVECPNAFTVLWVTNGTPGTEEQNTINKLTALGYTVTVVDDNVGGNANNFAVTFVYEDVFSGDADANVMNMTTTSNGVVTSEPALHDEILGASTGGNGTSTEVEILNNSHPITSGLPLGNYNIGDAQYFGNGLTTGTVLGRDPASLEGSVVIWDLGDAMETGTAPGKRAIVPHSNGGGGFNAAGEDLLVNAIIWASQMDTDGDGLQDCVDTDSDGDGCGDADEAYGDVDTDLDDNGRYGSGSPAVNGDGTVTAASYTTPVDGDSNTVLDFLEAGTAASITTQPTDSAICPSGNTSFTVAASNADAFQWQLFNGSTWDDLTDSGIHGGTTTTTLAITGANVTDNGNQYRVVVSNSSYVCGTQISNTVTLTVEDTTAPVISGCPTNISVNVDSGTCGAVVTWTPPTANDNCGGVTLTNNNYNPGDSFLPGVTTVVYTATDDSGNSSTCSFTVTVNDNEAPTINGPSDITVSADSGVCEAVVNYTLPTVSDNCAMGDGTFPVFEDFEVPNRNALINECWQFAGSTVSTNNPISGSTSMRTSNLISTEARRLISPLVYLNGNGQITFTHRIDQARNNNRITVSLVDEADVATVIFNEVYSDNSVQTEIIDIGLTGNYRVRFDFETNSNASDRARLDDLTIPGLKVADTSGSGACPAATLQAVQTAGFATGGAFPVGTTTNTYEVTDAFGNTSTYSFDITVTDDENPTASNPAPVAVFCASDVPVADPLVVTDEADNCTANPTVTFIGDVSDGGTNPETITRTYRVEDASGNTTDVTQTITVSQFLINTQPANLTVIAGNNGTFSVTAVNVDTYQWQVSTNGGVSYSDISDGTEYTGTQTATLIVNSPDVDKNGYLFRVVLSNSTSSCPDLISNSATLTIRVGRVITNRRITYRVKKN
ncbi:HYR domain-containing protein [Flagellimonas meridianipacifica]|uniref:Subtilisin-like proprotein convertase family protein n=1 Tax=Flagellimonas meridianipacifica TaxID=1080225 RepID=A0A2T0M6Z9_9FLAO|nr:HYR domain-containing protein [Allomuricauda pacifica]PRX53155.1 subtilisin-like proprotein convertase family protein [Allomuricauda pacifica]